MRLLRLFVITAMLVSLPGYGLAAAGQLRGCLASAPLGAAHVAHAPMGGMHMDVMATSDDCCPGAGGQHAPDPHPQGKDDGCASCLAGHGCKSPQGAQSIPAPPPLMFPAHPVVIDAVAANASLCGPDGPLRPPDPA
jgi:hypothetical protein